MLLIGIQIGEWTKIALAPGFFEGPSNQRPGRRYAISSLVTLPDGTRRCGRPSRS
ncbi:hypothetical protein Pan258_22930 [Symmachiella dynata]|nr:hypothetical protein Pan258_22930 [Symmachiella dynata]